MRVSRTGLAVSGTYAVLSAATVVYGISLGNAKDSSKMTQLSVIPALLLADTFGLATWLEGRPWYLSLIVFVPATAVVLYAVCWLFGSLRIRTRLAIGVCLLLLLAVLHL